MKQQDVTGSPRKRRLKFLLRSRPRPAGPLPKPGELEGRLMPREQRPQKHMFWRTRREFFTFGRVPRMQSTIWGDYSFDNLFRLGLGMLIGYWPIFSSIRPNPDSELYSLLMVILVVGLPVGTLVSFGLRWRGQNVIRKHLFFHGMGYGAACAAIPAVLTHLW